MVKIKIMIGLMEIKIMLVYNIYKIVFINKIVVMYMGVTKQYAFSNRKQAQAKPQHVNKGFTLYKINKLIHQLGLM